MSFHIKNFFFFSNGIPTAGNRAFDRYSSRLKRGTGWWGEGVSWINPKKNILWFSFTAQFSAFPLRGGGRECKLRVRVFAFKLFFAALVFFFFFTRKKYIKNKIEFHKLFIVLLFFFFFFKFEMEISLGHRPPKSKKSGRKAGLKNMLLLGWKNEFIFQVGFQYYKSFSFIYC